MASVKKNVSDGPYQRNYTRYRGASIAISGRFMSNGTPVDVSADAFFLHVVDRRNAAVVSLSVGDGITFPADNQPLAVLNTASFPIDQQLHYTFRWVRASDGLVTDLQSGYITITLNDPPTS